MSLRYHFTAEERAEYGRKMRARRTRAAALAPQRAAERAAWEAAHPPAYCTVKRRDAEGVLRYVDFVHGPYAGCDGCNRARAAGVVPAENAMQAVSA